MIRRNLAIIYGESTQKNYFVVKIVIFYYNLFANDDVLASKFHPTNICDSSTFEKSNFLFDCSS